MKARTANWYLCKIRYPKTAEDGTQRIVTEQYVIDALSFSEAEERITESMGSYISGEFDIKDITMCPFKEVFFSDEETADNWYKVKLQFITLDERTEKERKSNILYLVQAGSFNGAVKNIDEVMGGTMIDYRITMIQETNILDVVEYKK